jgi:hypothetical protein
MKPEPQLIDLFAMFALMNQTNDSSLFGSDEYQRLIAERSYRMAAQMMKTRERFIGDKDE